MSYRILSLDGGGSWALIQVKALIALYGAGASGRTVLQDFNLVAANSGGSIVLGCLVEDFTLGDILAFFNDPAKRTSVFAKSRSFGDRVLHDLTGLGPKYSADDKLPALQSVLVKTGNKPLTQVVAGLRRSGADADLHLLIVSFDYDRKRACFFRSSDASGTQMGTGSTGDVTLAEAIHASTNAPVNYFDGPATFADRPGAPGNYWDGAMTGCNNPILVAVTEAIIKKAVPTDVAALSLGTGTVALPWPQPDEASSPLLQTAAASTFVNDLRAVATVILDDPPDMATFTAHVMTGGSGGEDVDPRVADSRIVRMSPMLSPIGGPGKWMPPGTMTVSQLLALTRIDMDAIDQTEVDAISRYADLWLQDGAPNQPVRMDGDTLTCELGQRTFSQAKAAWNAIR